jgi:hypothetical protein
MGDVWDAVKLFFDRGMRKGGGWDTQTVDFQSLRNGAIAREAEKQF